MMLCEVALGTCKKVWAPEAIEKLPPGLHSVHAVGKMGPEKAGSVIMPSGVEVPCGKIVDLNDVNPVPPAQPVFGGFGGGFTPPDNEFIVYNTDQVRIRYVLQVCQKSKEEMKK